MSSWRSGRGLQWQPVKLWWTPCPGGLRQRWKIMVDTQNIDTLGPIWTFSLRGVLTFVASGLDINGCVLSYFEGTANLHCYTSCTLTTLHCRKCHFFSVVTWKGIITFLQNMRGVLTSVRYCIYKAERHMYTSKFGQWQPLWFGVKWSYVVCVKNKESLLIPQTLWTTMFLVERDKDALCIMWGFH